MQEKEDAMSIHVEKLPHEPIIVSTIVGLIDMSTLRNVINQSRELTKSVDEHFYYVINIHVSTPQVMSLITEAGRNRFEMPSNSDAVFVGNPAIVKIVADLFRKNISASTPPIFQSMDGAMEYIRVKIAKNSQRSTRRMDMLTDINGISAEVIRGRTNSITNRKVTGVFSTPDTLFPVNGQVRLEIKGAAQPFVQSPQRGIIIGRGELLGVAPDFDLTPHGAYHMGVSRHHAKICLGEDRILYTMDLSSSNGTFLNGERLTPYQLAQVRDGDQIKIGKLPIKVRFQ